MIWQAYHGDILDVPADVLVCSANVYLTLSGGVGGAFLLRFGPAMQDELNRYLADRGVRHVEQGEVIATHPCGSPYHRVLHAVAVDGSYETSLPIVSEVLRTCLQMAAESGARVVAFSALATGYGRQSIEFFAQAVSVVMDAEYPPVELVVIGVRSRNDLDAIVGELPRLEEV